MDKLSQISLQNTVTVKIDYQLNQQLLVKNFGIIMDCLKDLKGTQDKHSSDISNLAGLRELIDKLREDVRLKEESKGNDLSDNNGIDKIQLENLQKEIELLKGRMTKNEGSTHDNTKDINILLKDMKDAKEDIENLKKQLHSINSSQNNNLNIENGDKNLSRNDNLNSEMLSNLNNQSRENQQALNKTIKQMQEMKNHLKKLQNQLKDIKNLQQQQQSLQNFNEQSSTQQQNIPSDLTLDDKSLNDIMKKLQFLTKKTENIQGQVLNNTRGIHELNESVQKNVQEIDGVKENVGVLEEEIEEIKKLLEELQRQQQGNGNGEGRDRSNSNSKQLQAQIMKLKQMYDKLLKMINALKTTKSEHDNTNNAETDRLPTSSKNIQKFSQDKSFRKRSQSVDVNGKIRQLTQRIRCLQKLIGDDNPQKLPSIGWKNPNKTSYNGEKSHKKEISQMKNDLEIWIKSYLDSMGKSNGGNLVDLELKVQEMRTVLGRKADHQGMKKGLAFLEGKITQLYLFLTEPQNEDAMIVRKGFNCLSCSKKVQSLRGKLGPRMNWDNLNTTHQNMHTPPKAGFPKYNDSNERDSL